MKIRLLTQALELVDEIDIIPFRVPPEVITWGVRVFVKLENAGPTADTGAIRYREVFAYAAPTLSINR